MSVRFAAGLILVAVSFVVHFASIAAPEYVGGLSYLAPTLGLTAIIFGALVYRREASRGRAFMRDQLVSRELIEHAPASVPKSIRILVVITAAHVFLLAMVLSSRYDVGGPRVTDDGVNWVVDGRVVRIMSQSEYLRYNADFVRLVSAFGVAVGACGLWADSRWVR